MPDHPGRSIFLAKAFPDIRFLSPLLDFTKGYAGSTAMVEMAVRRVGCPRELAARPGPPLCAPKRKPKPRSANSDGQPSTRAVAAGKPTILLAGHSYNAFTPEASQSVGKKLSSMGVTVIPADCLMPVEDGTTAWHFANQILNAVALAQQHPNLFLLCVSNFSCTIDAFTHSMLARRWAQSPI